MSSYVPTPPASDRFVAGESGEQERIVTGYEEELVQPQQQQQLLPPPPVSSAARSVSPTLPPPRMSSLPSPPTSERSEAAGSERREEINFPLPPPPQQSSSTMGKQIKFYLSNSSRTIPSFEGDPIIFHKFFFSQTNPSYSELMCFEVVVIYGVLTFLCWAVHASTSKPPRLVCKQGVQHIISYVPPKSEMRDVTFHFTNTISI